MRTCSISCFLKLLVRALIVMGLMWILLAGMPERTVGTTTKTRSTNLAAESPRKMKAKDQVVVGTEEKLAHHDPKLDLINYMSKRRVPNGPDPIHNRYYLLLWLFFRSFPCSLIHIVRNIAIYIHKTTSICPCFVCKFVLAVRILKPVVDRYRNLSSIINIFFVRAISKFGTQILCLANFYVYTTNIY